MEIPSDIFVNHTVEQGSIYYFPEESFLPKECPELKKETAFDCNRLILKSLSNLIQKKEEGDLNYKGKLTNDVLMKLVKGVLASPMVERKYKKIIALN